jgi:hypothetical protein
LEDEEWSKFITIEGQTSQNIGGQISLKSHPIFMVPWYHLHPCGMHELVKELEILENRKSVVFLFLSVLQEILGIKLIHPDHSSLFYPEVNPNSTAL